MTTILKQEKTMTLRLLKDPAPAPPPPDYASIYQMALSRKLISMPRSPDKEWMFQTVYLTVKGLPIISGYKARKGFIDRPIPEERELRAMWSLILRTKGLVSQLTPRELTRIFPITKRYDGARYESKDYFSTIEAIEEIGMDNVIGDTVDELLFDYQNRHITNFSMFILGVCSDLRRHQGQPGVMEEFMEQEGITPLRMVTDDDGKRFLYDPVKHTTMPVVKKRPRYLRVVPDQKVER
jgi:hypothetical protein